MRDKKFKYSLLVLIVFHVVGIGGLLSPYKHLFLLLTPLNLILSGLLLWINHTSPTKTWVYFVVFTFTLGFLMEYLGANFGFLFGDYSYGETLGFKLWNVPLIIGLNWILIIYSVATTLDSTSLPVWAKIFLGSCLAVFMDWLIEPIAIQFDFWNWDGTEIPLQNYSGWMLTSLVMLSAYYLWRVRAKNKLALPLFIVQGTFFGLLQIAALIRGSY
jgi:bisanhydrobacterioruberin hydratase